MRPEFIPNSQTDMTSPRCKVGDLAVVVQAKFPSNLGRIVQVVGLHDGTGDIVYTPEFSPVWLVVASTRLTWTCNGKRYRRKSGPVPDQQLQPIRGLGSSDGSDVKVLAPVPMVESRVPA